MSLKQADFREERVEVNQFRNKVIQIKASYFNKIKFILVVSVFALAVLAHAVVKLNNQTQAQAAENTRLLQQVSILQSQIEDEADKLELVTAQSDSTNSKALGYINSIQSKLSKINTYLNKRGLKSIAFKTIKTDKANAKGSKVQLYSKYNRYLERLVDDIAAMPMGYPRVSSFTSFFGYRGNPFNFGRSEFHPGLDFRGQMGDQVKCTASGKVVFTGRAGGYGNCVRIRHTNNLETWYGHLSRILVKEGQRVNVGELIGKVGSTGRSTGPHLHYEVRKNGKPVNPVQYLSLN